MARPTVPAAIITASQQVELYDREYGEASRTLRRARCRARAAGGTRCGRRCHCRRGRSGGASGKLVVGLGGEHHLRGCGKRPARRLAGRSPSCNWMRTATCATLRGLAVQPRLHRPAPAGAPGVEQVLQLGIRSVCGEESTSCATVPRARVWYAEDVHAGGWQAEFIERVRGRQVFLTIDVDGLDQPSCRPRARPNPMG